MKVLILGGTGVISTGITQQLLERGDLVTHFNRGKSSDEFEGKVVLVEGDRNSRLSLEETLTVGSYDAVIDMICFTAEQAKLSIEVFRGKVPQYIFCSTVDVYTKPAEFNPVTEIHPRNPSTTFEYAFEKALAEDLFFKAHEAGDFKVTILRPGATYINGAVPSIGNFALYLDRLRRGLPVIIHGDGSSIWVSCHRDDVARAFVNSLGNERAYGNSYNVTGQEWLTWNEYWSTVAQHVGGPNPEFIHIPTDLLLAATPDLAEWCGMNFQYNNIMSNEAAKRDLDFQYRTTWAQGVSGFDFDKFPSPDSKLAQSFERLLQSWDSLSKTFVKEQKNSAK